MVKKTRPLYRLPKTDSFQIKKHTHTKMRWNEISRDGPRGQYISGISQRKTNAMIVQIHEI